MSTRPEAGSGGHDPALSAVISERRRLVNPVRPAEVLPAPAPAGRRAGVVRDFKRAWEAADIAALIGLLDPGVTLTADGGGLVPAALRPVEGAERVARYLAGLATQAPGGLTLFERTVNGQPGLIGRRTAGSPVPGRSGWRNRAGCRGPAAAARRPGPRPGHSGCSRR